MAFCIGSVSRIAEGQTLDGQVCFFQVFTCPPFLRKVAMYVLRHSGNASCGYLEAGGKYFALQPHPASGVPRLIFPHGQVQISGRVNAIASPL